MRVEGGWSRTPYVCVCVCVCVRPCVRVFVCARSRVCISKYVVKVVEMHENARAHTCSILMGFTENMDTQDRIPCPSPSDSAHG